MLIESPLVLSEGAAGLGTLIVVGPQRLLCDPTCAYSVLQLGNDDGRHQIHIICSGTPADAHPLLDRVFSVYVRSCCYELWCDAYVNYTVNGEVVLLKEYGFSDGQYTLYINVHCGVADDQVNELIAKLAQESMSAGRVIVVRPGSELELGYAVSELATGSPADAAVSD